MSASRVLVGGCPPFVGEPPADETAGEFADAGFECSLSDDGTPDEGGTP
jgi:hypothetical protein